MKLALIGGGGVRAPEFVRGAVRMADGLDVQELWLMDTDGERLALIAPLCAEIARGSRLQVRHTTSLDEALRGADAIVTTIRVGGERGRALDERIALSHGVLGQETTGAGGFAMALRSIPAILRIAERAAELASDAWLFNFTNPAGLVAQALHDAGYERVVGICDSANTAQHEIARWAGVGDGAVRTEVYGLNHLSWARAAYIDGRDVLPEALADDAFLAHTHLKLFDAELVRRKGAFLNEYLWYWYYRDVALRTLLDEPQTRGEQIVALSAGLFDTLRGRDAVSALAAYEAYQAERGGSYMKYGSSSQVSVLRSQSEHPVNGVSTALNPEPRTANRELLSGYAGVALKTLAALRGGEPLRIGLNVPNGMALAACDATDVVEISCTVSSGQITPHVFMEGLPEDDTLLMQAVKRYERLTVAAIAARSRVTAIDALMAHPLVGSYPTAKALVAAYLDAHGAYSGEWR
jgi:6-phospho-beta-glucosidase